MSQFRRSTLVAVLALIGAASAVATGCIDAKIPGCQAGQQTSCACADGTSGIQTCASDGSTFSACTCAAASGGGGSAPTGESKSAGQTCSKEGAVVCASASTHVLVCTAGKYHDVHDCGSSNTCAPATSGDSVACKHGTEVTGWYAPTDGACYKENAAACAFDGRTTLDCSNGAWAIKKGCPGRCGHVAAGGPTVGSQCPVDSKNGCTACVLPAEGDPCSDRGYLFCDETRTGALRCDGARFHSVFECPPGQACVDLSGFAAVQCGAHSQYAVDGDPCSQSDLAACSFDSKQLVHCSGTVWVAEPCSGSCGFVAPGQTVGNMSCPESAPSGCEGCL